MDPDSNLRISVSDGRGRPVRDGGLSRWLARVAPSSARGDLAIALVSDARMRALNRTFRRRDYATDVLSFLPSRSASEQRTAASGPRTAASGPRTADDGPLGDIVIATGVARRQARDAGHSPQTELRVLALHGLLHLLGYDHDRPGDRGRMARAEARLRRRGGLPAGLIARHGPPSEAKAARPRAARARPASAKATAARRRASREGGSARTRAGVGPRERQR